MTTTSTPPASTRRTPATKPDPVPGALERCVGDATTFAERHWGTAPLHRTGDDHFADVFGLADVDAIVSSATRRPEIRLVRAGERVEPRHYCVTLRLGGQQVSDVVDPAKLADQLTQGATVVLQSLHRTWPPVGRFLADLEAEVSHPVQANAYLTPAGAAGLAPHADTHDVVVLQLHGTKEWEVEGLGALTLTPGDTMYLPAGTEHSATAQASASLHLTIGILRVTYGAVLERIVGRMEGITDQPLPLGYTHDRAGDLESGIDDLLAAAGRHLSSIDPDDVADSERRRRRLRVGHEGHVSSVVRLTELGADSRVVLRPGPPPAIEPIDEGRVELRLGDRDLQLPITARPALDLLCAGDPVVVSDLPDLDAESQVVLARRLVQEGMLRLADGPRGSLV